MTILKNTLHVTQYSRFGHNLIDIDITISRYF